MKVDDSDLKQPLDMPEAAPSSRAHQTATPKRKRRPPAKLLVAILGLAVIAIGFWLFTKQNQSQETTSNSSQTSTTPQKTETATDYDIKSSAQTTTYENSPMRAEITYPKNWKVTENDYGFTVTSPSFTIKTADKGDVKGVYTVYVRQGARDIDGKYIGKGVAIAPTETLTYKNPGVGQRTSTNFTQFGADVTDHFTFFMVTGDFKLQKGETLGPNYGKEASTFIIVGGYKADGLKDDLAYSNIPLEYYSSTTAYKQAAAIIKSLKITG